MGRSAELERAVAIVTATGSAASGLAIHGLPGVGRSRFLSELLAVMAQSGRPVMRTVATRSASTIPLGAFAHLLPADAQSPDATFAPFDFDHLLEHAVQALDAVEGLVLAVDDVHLLDAVSIVLLQRVMELPTARVVVTVRSGELAPEALSTLWQIDRVARMDLAPFDLESVELLLHRGLLGPMDGRAIRVLYDATGGVALLLREIVRSAVDQKALTKMDGVWRLVGPLPTGQRAVELVTSNLVGIDANSRLVLEFLALVGETPLPLLDPISSMSGLEKLEKDGLITIRDADAPAPGRVVRIARPGLADALRAEVLPLRRRHILSAHIKRFEAWSDGNDSDAVLIVGWQLDAGVPVVGAELERAAGIARDIEDFLNTARFAEAVEHAGGTLRSTVLWGDALYELSRWEECERVFALGARRPGSPLDRIRLVSIRSSNLLFGLMRFGDALSLIEESIAEVDEGDAAWTEGLDEPSIAGIRSGLVSRIANLQMYGGQPAAAIATLGLPPNEVIGEIEDPKVRDALRLRVLWALPGVPAIALAGRTGEAVALARQAIDDHQKLGGEIGLASVGTHFVTLSFATIEHGSLDDARALASFGYDECVTSGALLGQIWFCMNLARIAMFTGHPVTTLKWAREILAATRASGWLGPRAIALNGFAAASALLGDVASARSAIAEAEAIGDGFGFLLPERVLGRALTYAAEGRRDEGRNLLLQGAEHAARTGHLTSESSLLYEAARISGGADVLDRLNEIASNSDSLMVRARAQYVGAMVADGAPDLELAAAVMLGLGCNLAASELYVAASERMRTDGLARAANAFAQQARDASSRSEGATSFRLSRLHSAAPLTAREREIAELVAIGLSSKAIAHRLDLSVRTVTNHLQNVYVKLGVSSRADVLDILNRHA